MSTEPEAIGVDFQLEPDGRLDLQAIAPALKLMIMKMFEKGFDETTSVSGEVKDGRFILTYSKPDPQLHSLIKSAMSGGKKPVEA